MSGAQNPAAAAVSESDERVAAVYEQLLGRVGEANPRPRIEPVRRLAALAGSPQLDMRFVHVAGTNGKTSTSRATEALLRAHGLRTGLFTSPHLESFTERIQVDGEPVSADALAAAWEELQAPLQVADAELAAAGQGPITFFEALAVLALLVFADAPVEVAVVEVGMGGEWDATNIIAADTVIITPVALDHQAFLGETVAEIARTKAGIITPGARVVSAVQQPDAAAAIAARAAEVGAQLFVAGEHFSVLADALAVGGRQVTLQGLSGSAYEPTFVPLHGGYQAANVSLAVAAAELVLNDGEQLAAEPFEQGLGSVTSPGRLQLLGQNPPTYTDAAHNPHGAHALAQAVTESFNFAELGLVLGSFGDKDSRGVLRELLPVADRVWVTPVDSPRTLAAGELVSLAREVAAELGLAVPVDEESGLDAALAAARAWGAESAGRGVLVTGSVVLAGEALSVARKADWGIV